MAEDKTDAAGGGASGPASSSPGDLELPPGVVLVQVAGVNPPWFSARSAEGEIYYFNDETGETSWSKPVTSGGSRALASVGVDGDDSLPKPWVQVRKPSGEVYYWNEATDETSWTRPLPDGSVAKGSVAGPKHVRPTPGDDSLRPAPVEFEGPALALSQSKNAKDIVERMLERGVDPNMQIAGMVALKNLTHRSSGGKLAAADAGAIPVVVSAMSDFPGNERLQEWGTTVLRSLARRSGLIDSLVRSGATDVCHAAKRSFPRNPVIARLSELTVNSVYTQGEKSCAVM